jgi:hypothetical protein
MNCKVLTAIDRNAILDLFERNKKTFKREPPQEIHLLGAAQIIENLEKNPQKIMAVGIFNDEQNLMGTLCAFRWQKLPYYTIRGLKVDNPTGSVKTYIRAFDALLSYLLKTFESERRLDFYFLNYQRNFHRNHLADQHKLREIPHYFTLIQRYDLILEEVIEPGRNSKFAAFQEMTDFRTFEIPVWIRRASLKADFRNALFLAQNVHERSLNET